MNDIEVVLAKVLQRPVKGWNRQGIVLRNGKFHRPKPKNVRMLVFVAWIISRKQVNGVSQVTKLINEIVDRDAHPVEDGQGAIGKDCNAQPIPVQPLLLGKSTVSFDKLSDVAQAESTLTAFGPVVVQPATVGVAAHGCGANSKKAAGFFKG